jgi:hypothetical protein
MPIGFDKARVVFWSRSWLSISFIIRVVGRLSILLKRLCASRNGMKSCSNWNNGRSFSLALRLRKSWIDERNLSVLVECRIGSRWLWIVESRLWIRERRFIEENWLELSCSSSSLVCFWKWSWRCDIRRFGRRRAETIVLELSTSILIIGLDSCS